MGFPFPWLERLMEAASNTGQVYTIKQERTKEQAEVLYFSWSSLLVIIVDRILAQLTITKKMLR